MRNRIHELDYLKCLFIILMIIFHLSHIGSKYPYAKSIVYTFHMPAFLLISGYLINVHKKPEIFLKAMAWIFIPYTIMEISYACMSMLFPVWDGIKEISASVLLGKVLLDPIGPYWYLHTFILCGTTYYFVHTYLSSTPFIRLLVTSSLLLLFSYIFHLLTFANAFYFMAGTAIHLGKRPFLSCFPASFLAIIPLVFLCSQPENLNRGTLGGILITGLVISLSLYIYKHLPHTVKQASLFIGKNTLPILLISGYLINVHKKPEIFLKAMAWIFIPYTIMEISYACMSMLFPVWDGIKEISASVLLGKVLLDPIGPYWYLHTFILCGTTYYFVHTYLSSTPFIRLLVTSSLLLLFSYIFHLLTFANAFYFMAGTAIHLGKRPFLSCFPASFLAIIPLVFLCSQPENLNRGTLGGILITGLVISLSLYIYKHLPHTVKQASLFIGKNTLPILLFSPVFTALSKLFLPFFSFDPTGICFLCTATVITLYGSIFIAFCLDKACLSPFFFFGKKILI